MFCTHCGHEVSDGAKFCTFCGARLAHFDEPAGSAAESTSDAAPEEAAEKEAPDATSLAAGSSDEGADDASPEAGDGQASLDGEGGESSDGDGAAEPAGTDEVGEDARGGASDGGTGDDGSEGTVEGDAGEKAELSDAGETTLLDGGETTLLNTGETTLLGNGETTLLDTGETALIGADDATHAASASGETTTVPAAPVTTELPKGETEAFPAEDEGEPAADGLDVLPETPASQATKFCVNCGATVPVGARFCTNCGQLADVPAGTQPSPEAAPTVAPSEPAQAHQGPAGPAATGEYARPASGGHASTGLVVLVTALVTLAVACGIVAGLHYVGALGNPQALSFLPMREQPDAAPATTDAAAQATTAAPATTAATPAATASAAQNVTLKDFKGQDEQAARDGIAAAGLTVGKVTTQSSDSVEKGRVISQSVTGSAKKGTTVDLVVSSGSAAATPAQRQYVVVDQAMTWEQAKAYCEQNGGHLAVVQTEDDWNRVLALMKADGRKVFWLGASRVNGNFQWVDGSALSYSAFASGEPNNETGDENYLAVFNSNDNWGWYDVPNDLSSFYKPERMAFVMEKD